MLHLKSKQRQGYFECRREKGKEREAGQGNTWGDGAVYGAGRRRGVEGWMGEKKSGADREEEGGRGAVGA